MYEREENAPFSLISYSKERRFRVFQTLPDSWKNKKLLQVLTWFLKLVYYRDYLGEIWRNSKIHDCQPILENYRHWLLIICIIIWSTKGTNINITESFKGSHSWFKRIIHVSYYIFPRPLLRNEAKTKTNNIQTTKPILFLSVWI